ncbi:MAG: PTS sugar transporter subunit IIC [Clostridia bacterium]|nr:PTS sugar transporter subunit IIC [Clostridia bacterium]
MGKKFDAVKGFLKRKNVTLSPKKYFVDAMGSMALGLFATLLMGTILSTVGKYAKIPFFTEAASFATAATGAVLGVAIAFKLEAPPLVLFSAAVAGLAGNNLGGTFTLDGVERAVTAGPAGAFFCALVATEIGKLVSKETPVDILVTPLVTIFAGFGVAKLLCFPIAWLMFIVGDFVNTTTALYPVFMGAIVAVVVGVVLTLPISSAALCAMIGITGVAGGAAAAGCCAQMVGFAVISFKENKTGGLIAQGLGTSMLQMGNIVKNPRIWIPPTLASVFTGALSAAVFKLPCSGVSAGMGTCGLVGPIGIISDLVDSGTATALQWIGLPLIAIVLPAVLSLAIAIPMRKLGWIKDGDMKLDL